jgi:hypothetical protein
MEEDGNGIGYQLLSILSFHPSFLPSFLQVINSVEKTHLILLLLQNL